MSSEFDTTVNILQWMHDADNPIVEFLPAPPLRVLGALGLRLVRKGNAWTIVGIEIDPDSTDLTPTASLRSAKGIPSIVSYQRATGQRLSQSWKSGSYEKSMPSDKFYQEWLPWISPTTAGPKG